jgi:hypothetical protein
MRQKIDYETHPGVSTAMNVDEVKPNVDFVSYKPNDEIVMEGMFTSEASYDENDFRRWTAKVRMLGETANTSISLSAIGITRNDDGTWSEVVTIPRD